MRIKIAMLLMSVIFMLAIAVIFNISKLLPDNSDYALAGLMSIISLFGSVLFLLEARKVLPRWYLAIPFCISLLLIAILCFWEVSSEAFLSSNVGIVKQIVSQIVFILLTLLSPFSVLIFLSLHKHPYSMTAYLAVSSIASVISMFSFFLAVLEILIERVHNTSTIYISSLVILYIIYCLIVMPIMGLTFLVRAMRPST